MPRGRPVGSTKGKHMADALILALNRVAGTAGKERYLNVIAAQLVKKAAEGDVMAIREVFDRVDGKPHQSIGGDPENPIGLRITWGTSQK